ncbi:coiled-coil domain-containing protein 96 [Manis pentadactyla]|uniref:coiled-coil domain-containing protein 96 n=1 Tax=Manis pentadactyla TaxID=143292 RepID=UPI00255C8189|nr:coiled-coil domain-containing protein 96 [Manis pentadactyla]
MDPYSEHTEDPEGEHREAQSLASRASGTKASSGPQSPAEPAEPEPKAVETSEAGAAADEFAEPREGQAAAEDESEERPGKTKRPAEADPGEPAEAGPEQPALPGSEGGPEKQEEDQGEEAEAAEGRRKETPPQGSAPPSTPSQEEAAPVREVEGEGKGVHRSRAESGEELTRPGERLEGEGHERTEEERKLEERKLQEQQLRHELLGQYRSLTVERSRYLRYNIHLQHKIFEALRKKKGLDAAEVPDKGTEPEAPEKERAYLRRLAALEGLRKQQADDLGWYHRELGLLKQQCKEKLSRVETEWRGFQALKKQVAMQAMGSCWVRGGRQAALREVEQMQALEDKKEKAMSAVRLENVQLRQSLAHLETRMRAQGDLTEGLPLIDFEQLKIENQTFNEKVEERNEELLKLRNKVTNNVQIITHVKEKLNFVDLENTCKKSQLLEIEAQVALGRDILTKTKQTRDSLRIDNIKLNQKCGLLGKESLLQDMEEKVDKTNLLNRRLESLKRHHAGLSLSCRGVKQKVREAKAFLPS